MVSLSLEHGNCDASTLAYVYVSMIAGPRFDNYEAGIRFGTLACNLLEQRGLNRYRARTYGTTNIQRWRHGVLLLRMLLLAARRLKFW